MTKTYEPDSRFVERLEWQLASEYRRTNRLKPSAGKVAVPRGMVAVALVAGALLTGVAVIKAADSIKDSWRKKIEVARVETEVRQKRAFLEYKRESASKAEAQVASGLIREQEYQVMKLAAERSAVDLEKSLLDLEEVKASGEVPRNELYAPVVGGRDFVRERLKLEKKTAELDLGLRRDRTEPRFKQMVAKGLVSADQLDEFRAGIAAQEAMIEGIQRRLDLRKRFVAGEITAEEVEIRDRTADAERKWIQTRSTVDLLKKRLERLQALETRGMISKTEVQQLQFALDAAQSELSLAALEKDVLEKIK